MSVVESVTGEKAEIKKDPISIDCIMACLYFACLPLTIVSTPFGSVLKLVTMPTVAILSVRLILGKSKLVFNYLHLSYFLYILYTVSLLVVYHVELATVTTKDMVLGLLTFLLISLRVYNEREKELMEWAWIVVGVICVYAVLSSKEVMNQYEARVVIRIFGYEEDQNHICAYFIMAVIISIKRIVEKRKLTPVYIVFILLIMYSILKTGSRGGLIGVVLGAFAYIIIGIKSVKAKVAICIATVLMALVVVTVVFPMLDESVQERYSVEQVEEDGGSGRFEIWEYLLKYTFEKPERIIHGSGIFSTYDIMANAPEGFLNGVAHNTFIQVFNDQGLIGIILFIFCIFSCIWRTWRIEKMYTCAFLALMAFSMSLTFYVFKPYLNIMMMCAMSFEGQLPEDILKRRYLTKG